MSIANGKQQKRIGKKQSGVSTAAVYPILQENHTRAHKGDSNIDLLDSSIADSDVSLNASLIKAQCVRGRPAVEHTIASSVAELVSEVIPQSNGSQNLQSEPICWVKIQKCVCEFRGRYTTFVIVIGLARGYQIWTMLENGDCEEVASERKGPLRCAHLLPFVTKGVDKYQDHRPLFAMVDGNPMSSDRKHCTMSFLSLKTGKTVHSLDFFEPILDIETSAKYFLVVLSEKLIVCDHETLNQRFSVTVPSNDGILPCYAVSDNLLAFVESTLDKQKQSCGGVMSDAELSYGGQVINAAKTLTKTMASIGESFVSSFTASSQCKKPASNGDLQATNDTGIVSVINVNSAPSPNKNSFQHYIAHFVAHDTAFVGHLSMGSGGNLVLTGAQDSTTFHLFLLHPHPTSVKLSSVQHIYTLHRGNSAAKVIQSAFSADNRWLSISTNHGTTHVYAITPYGGPINARTHCGRLVNKESRFQRSAGINAVKQINAMKAHSLANKTAIHPLAGFREHPALTLLPVMSQASVNPRLTYYEPPVQLYSLAKLKHRAFSAENWSAWASDNTTNLLGSGGGTTMGASGRHHSFHGQHALPNGNVNVGSWLSDSSNRRMAVAFDTSFCANAFGNEVGYGPVVGKNPNPAHLCMYIMNSEGMFVEHKIEIRYENQSHHNNSSANNTLSGSNDSLASCNGNTPTSNNPQDASIRAKVTAAMQWILRRNRGASSVEVVDPPLSASNSLMRLCGKSLESDFAVLNGLPTGKHRSDSWLRKVEVLTYSGPHRRLWMGPQFSFGVYSKNGHSNAQLLNVNNASNGDGSSFSSMQKCCPVLIEKNPVSSNGFNDNSTSRIVCGSWSSDIVDPLSGAGHANYASVKEKIEDAMRDISEMPTMPRRDSTAKKKVVKKRAPVAKCSNDFVETNDSIDLLNLSGMDL